MFVVTCFKQVPAFKGQYSVIQTVHFNRKLTCIKQPSVFKGHIAILLARGCWPELTPALSQLSFYSHQYFFSPNNLLYPDNRISIVLSLPSSFKNACAQS